MRADLMAWVRRLVALVFVVGLVALVAAVAALVRQAEGVPPLPIFVGVIASAGLILLAGACLALLAIAQSAKGVEVSLRRLASRSSAPASAGDAVRVFSGGPLRNVAKAHEAPEVPEHAPRTARPWGRALVAER